MRLERGITQAELARAMAHKSPSYISRLESGQERPELRTMAELFEAYAALGAPLRLAEVLRFQAACLDDDIVPTVEEEEAIWGWLAEQPECPLGCDGVACGAVCLARKERTVSAILKHDHERLEREFRVMRAKRVQAERGTGSRRVGYLLK